MVLYLVGQGWAYTETFYLRNSGDNSAPETVAGAFNAAGFNTAGNWAATDTDDAKIGPNDCVIILDDDGAITTSLTIQNSGLAGKPITIIAEVGAPPILAGNANPILAAYGKSYITFQDIVTVAAVNTYNAVNMGNTCTNIIFNNCNFSAGAKGILFTKGNSLTINGCNIHDNTNNGIEIGAADNINAYSISITNNIITGNGINGIDCYYGDVGVGESGAMYSVTISGNTITGNTQNGIRFYSKNPTGGVTHEAYGIDIDSNTIYSNGHTGISCRDWIATAQNYIRNNLVYSNCANLTQGGIWCGNQDGTIIENNISYNNLTTGVDGAGILIDMECAGVICRRNLCYGNAGTATSNSGQGIGVYGGTSNTGTQIYYNVCRNNKYGIWIGGAGVGTNTVYNNALVNNTTCQLWWQTDVPLNAATAKNNICYGGLYGMNISTGGAQQIHDYNCVYGASAANWGGILTQGANEISVNPLVVSATDFHLNYNSPCRDAGVAISGLTTDLDSLPVPRWGLPDIGAYEYQDRLPFTTRSTVTDRTAVTTRTATSRTPI